jgi:hypothetical protein
MEETLVQSDNNGVILKQYLEKTVRFEKDTCFLSRPRDVVFSMISRMMNNSKSTHEGMAHFLVKSGITDEAVKYLLQYHHSSMLHEEHPGRSTCF